MKIENICKELDISEKEAKNLVAEWLEKENATIKEDRR